MSNEDKLKTINQLLADHNLRLCEIRRVAGDAVSTFPDLADTPAAYTGHGSKVVSVKATEDGLEFTVAGGGGGASWAYVTGQYYTMEICPNSTMGSLLNIGIDTLWAYPIIIGQTQSFDRIAAYVYSAVAGSNFRLGIYDCDPSTGYPKDLIVDSGALSGASTGIKEATINVALDAELHYLAILGSHSIQFRATRRTYIRDILGRATPNNVYAATGWKKTSQAYGTLPDPFPGGAALDLGTYQTGIFIRAV